MEASTVAGTNRFAMWRNRGQRARLAVDVDAERCFVVYVREQLLLVLELQVRPQPLVQRFAERAALGIVIDTFRVQESGGGPLTSDYPGLRHEALVQGWFAAPSVAGSSGAR